MFYGIGYGVKNGYAIYALAAFARVDHADDLRAVFDHLLQMKSRFATHCSAAGKALDDYAGVVVNEDAHKISSVRLLKRSFFDCAICFADDDAVGQANKQTAFDHAAQGVDFCFEHGRVVNATKIAIDDVIAVVGDKRRVVLRVAKCGVTAQVCEQALYGLPAKGNDFNGQGKSPEVRHGFGFVGDDDFSVG